MENFPSIKEIKCERILSPTGISTIAPYVINPYRGCGFGCLYCYSQKNKCFQKDLKEWGSFVDVKINCIKLLEKELEKIKPEKILIGSTTEVYQQVEEKYLLTRNVIEVLNKKAIPFVLLTKSDLIVRDADILYNGKICFTINLHEDQSIKVFEKRSPFIKDRLKAIKNLKEKGIDVYIHTGPILPGFTDVEKIMEMVYGLTDRVNFEGFNFWMCQNEKIKSILKMDEIFTTEKNYINYCEKLKTDISELNKKYNYKINYFFQDYQAYWPSSVKLSQEK
jgi:DNA repair photolyase